MRPLAVPLGAFAVAAMASAIAARSLYGYGDFTTFHADASQWLGGGVLYPPGTEGADNLNLPHTTWIFVPFALLPLSQAWACWQLVQIALACDILRRLFTRGDWQPSPIAVALLALAPATLGQLAMAQLGWTLAWLTTRAWLSWEAQPARGAVWLGLAVALKPFVLVVIVWLIVRRAFRFAAVALATTTACILVGIAAFGPSSYVVWYARTQQITWEFWPLNWSLAGAWHRLAPAGASSGLWLLTAFVLGAAVWRSRRIPTNEPAGWILSLTAGLLCSPLGWGYYGWILLAPTAGWWRHSSGGVAGLYAKVAIACLLWPAALTPRLSINTLGLGLLAMAAATSSGKLAAEPAASR